jgi:hypothetical protein
VLFLAVSAVFGVLNTNKARTLREFSAKSNAALAEAQKQRLATEKQMKARGAEAPVPTKAPDTESKIAAAEADFVRTQTEKAELQAKVRQGQIEIAELQKRLEEAGAKEIVPETLPMPGTGDLQAQLEDTRRQLDHAEREKQLLSDKIQRTQSRAAANDPKPKVARPPRPAVRGTVLAVNQAYNFVVLNLGGRQGLEANTEMLVLRGGTLIGRIRISSVEPATAIGDIISNSLARGVQVQPGDIVVYAGS